MKALVLQVVCPDQPGIVARFSGFLFEQGANITALEQHVEAEDGLFFMRITADLSGGRLSSAVLQTRLQALGESLGAKVSVYDADQRLKVAVMVTQEESCLYDLALRQRSGELACDIPLVLSNREDLRRAAESLGLAFHCVVLAEGRKAEQEGQIRRHLETGGVDLLVLARYMQILSPDFTRAWSGRVINIHHGFLPAFKGGRPYRQAWERGVKIIGATAHYVTDEVDEGPIISQDVVGVSHQFSASEMARAGRDIERRVLCAAVKAHLERRILIQGKRTIIFH